MAKVFWCVVVGVLLVGLPWFGFAEDEPLPLSLSGLEDDADKEPMVFPLGGGVREKVEIAPHIVRLRLAGFLVPGLGVGVYRGLSLGYEYVFEEWISIATSFGFGAYEEPSGESTKEGAAIGVDASIFLMTPGESKAVLGIGFAIEGVVDGECRAFFFPVGEENATCHPLVNPVFFIGGRHQPTKGGFFFEGGAGVHAGFVWGLEMNVGYVF